MNGVMGRIRSPFPYKWFLFSAALFSAVTWAGMTFNGSSRYQCYDQDHPFCWGVEEVEGNRAFRLVNVATGERREWRFCFEKDRDGRDLDPEVNLFAGYVLSELVVYEGSCASIRAPEQHYTIIRGADRLWRETAYSKGTYFDGEKRPVLAKNCHNTPDDKSTVCDGGVAKFTQEENNYVTQSGR